MLSGKNIVGFVGISGLFLGSILNNLDIASAKQVNHKVSSIKIAQSSASEESNSKKTVEENDLKFQLQGCLRKNQRVSCNFLITNTDNVNRWFRLNWMNSSRVIDTNGNDYKVKLVTIGSEKPSRTFSRTTLVPGVPMKASFILELPPQVNDFAVLEIEYQYVYDGINNKTITIPFRNIKVSNIE
jgi:hypothetical protein